MTPLECEIIVGSIPAGAISRKGGSIWGMSAKTWTFFDPRPAFAAVNTIIAMPSGQVYWINVVSNQTATLNGQDRVLSAGWDLLSW